MNKKKRLVLIDGHSVVFRAFYAIPYLTDPDGQQVNAVYGFALILLNVITDLEPTQIAVTFDTSKPTFRHTDFAEYKAQRKETPSELIGQMDRVHEVVEALNIPVFEVEGFEADDVIGTLSGQASKKQDVETVIVTGDQDQFQLVIDDMVKVWMPARGKKPAVMYGSDEVVGKLGVRPDQVPDYKGLAGDSSDNIPGVRGIGPTTAVRILREFESIEEMYRFLDKIPDGKSDHRVTECTESQKQRLGRAGITASVLKKLVEGREMAEKSKMLATIITDVPIELDLEACKVSGYNKDEVIKLFDKLGFKSLIGKLPADEFELGVQEALF